MNEQIKKDRELLDSWESDYRAGFSQTRVKYSKAFELLIPLVHDLLAAQARVTQYEERQRVVELLRDYTPTIEDIGHVAGSQYQGLVVEWRVKNDELKNKILSDNN